ncbi:predicted protein [Clavispora lusitaniae ATCC 42720]|uniref:Uncharacterized protein n=1 Tax=Clavispora lusitaniae (strain ATCC 42720) TaxID=306902 RepID=C4YA80_CLAL4|nr:uncharacterized protein CLUG_05018 [Clavispora lusitaniae ATCC 42720]EEQ40890.1 predicted protein [Clavispora lusitaniae ATCC 42720]
MVSPIYLAKGKEHLDSEGFIAVGRRRQINSLKKEIRNVAEKPSISKNFADIAVSTNIFSAIGFGEDEPIKEVKPANKFTENKKTIIQEKSLICWRPLYSPISNQALSPNTVKNLAKIDEWKETEEKEKMKEPEQAKPITKTKIEKKMEKLDYQKKKMDSRMKKMDLKMKAMDLKMKKMDLKMKKMDSKLKKRALKAEDKKSYSAIALSSRPSSRDPNMSEISFKSDENHTLLHRLIFPL